MIKISCCQYQIEQLSNWDNYTSKIELLVKTAKKENSELLLLPEYAGTEIAFRRFDTEAELYSVIQSQLQAYIALYQKLAKLHQIYIQPGTLPVETTPGKYVNRAYFFSPNGTYGFQDKLQLTEFEKSIAILQRGEQQKIFDTSFGKIGIAICYDSEFPEIVRSLTQQGAVLILVPSYTTTRAGFNRVFLSARARAIENQCYVAISYVVNWVDLSDEKEMTHGQAAIACPADIGFPDDGILAQGTMNETALVSATLSFEKITTVRQQGHVLNFHDTERCASLKKIIPDIISLK